MRQIVRSVTEGSRTPAHAAASLGAERFEREIKFAARLQHPHILGDFDSGVIDGQM